ncbi:MAG: hypothetical protein A2857_01810 [Candidatus Levybacteria bacterium RIFCSPHIGHO2_01_FULL_36_15]|nr:MAG: hypothetical protein A2857_01810 [Candidatus Levybacteria bacterium RIFCSPHIGHO2_01_FULL_36_15]
MDKQSEVKYKPTIIEPKWQKYWEQKRIYSPDLDKAAEPFFNLMMFPYPSAEGLHVGNMYAFTGADVYARFMRAKGFDVFEPIGLDGFGIHSENYALKVGHHPAEQAEISQKNFYRQLRLTGNAFDWTRTVETYNPKYYKWTQWIFTQMFKNGLAVRKKAAVNFCPSCKTVLSDEQVVQKSEIRNPKSETNPKSKIINSKITDIEERVAVCERCETPVEKRDLEQWFFKITKYADRLLNNLENLDWTEKVKIAQRNWIGRKEGIIIKYKILNSKYEVECFTTRPDTNFGATFVVLSPDNALIKKILKPASQRGEQVQDDRRKEIEDYVEKAKKKTDQERMEEGREKTGVFTGLYCVNQLNNYKMPLYISDFVLMGFGTGAVVGVPGHDKRDFEFAKKFNLPVIRVVVGSDHDKSPITDINQVQEENGEMINSSFLDGLDIHQATNRMMDYLEEKGWGKRETTYHLRDWLISRQRYWGPPIPMVYCQNCADSNHSWFTSKKAQSHHRENSKFKIQNSKHEMRGWYPVPDDQLPVQLPYIKDFKPLGTGKSPLANHRDFYKAVCPECGGVAMRETDVSDTFLDSAWYFFRYIGTEFDEIPFPSEAFDNVILRSDSDEGSPDDSVRRMGFFANAQNDKSDKVRDSAQRAKKWLPVNMYIGGAEHAVLHLLYARFMTMFFKDLGYISFEEPFKKFYAHGLLIKEGAKMSKSRGNVIVPDEYIQKYGSDTLRCYLMFLGPFDQGGDFYDSGIEGMSRFVRRVWTMFTNAIAESHPRGVPQAQHHPGGDITTPRLAFMHKTIKKVTEDIENLRYNTAISALMEWYNYLSSNLKTQSAKLTEEEIITFLKLLAPFAPHMTEEIFQNVILRSKSDEGSHSSGDSSAAPQNDNLFRSIHLEPWPVYDEKYLEEEFVIIVIQVNGKRRGEISIKYPCFAKASRGKQISSIPASPRLRGASKYQKEVEEMAREKIRNFLEGKEIRKVVYVPGKIVNFVV